MRYSSSSIGGATLAVIGGGLLTQSVVAQDAASPAYLEEVIVTAQKRTQRLQDVPIQVDVLTADTLNDRQIAQTSEISRIVPNFSVQRTDTYSNSVVVMRGIAQASRSDSPVAVIVDGVPQDDVKQFNMRLFDVSQIEVARGPQGSIYGRNAVAGAVIITTTEPSDEVGAFADVSYGNRQTIDAAAGVSGALVPGKVQYRVAGSYYSSDGVIRNAFTGGAGDAVDYDYSLRGRLYFRIGERTTLDLIAGYSKFDAAGVIFAPVFSGDPNDFVELQSNFPNRGSGESESFTMRLESDLGFATFSSITGYTNLEQVQVTDLDFTSTPVLGNNQPYEREILSRELRLVSPGNQRLRWLVAADVLDSDHYLATRVFFDTGNPDTDPHVFGGGVRPEDSGRTAFGVSGQVDYDLTSKLTLTAGGRYDRDERTQVDNATGRDRDATFDLFQPRLSASYRFDDWRQIYATYAVGFRSGVFNGADFPIARSEELTNYELGFKSQWLDRSLIVNGALFYSDVENLQFTYIDFVRRANVTSNIDKVSIKGAELELAYDITGDFRVFSNVGYAQSEIETFRQFPQFVGNHTPRAADWTVTAGFDYAHSLSGKSSLFVHSDLQYTSERYWYYDSLDVQDSKTYWNMSAGFNTGTWTVTIWGKNLSDTEAYDTYFPSQTTGLPYDVGFPARPRTYGIELSMRY
jgi:iron complex outermembrane receptor protein